MGQTTPSPRKRSEEEALTAEGPTHPVKKKKHTGGSPAPTTPGPKGEALQPSKERTSETGKPRAPTPVSRSKLSTPRSSTAADALTILAAGGTISKAEYKGECRKAKAKRTCRDVSPANTSPAAQAADTPKKATPPQADQAGQVGRAQGQGYPQAGQA